MIWDGVPYLCPNKRKPAAFSKFSVIFGEEKLGPGYMACHKLVATHILVTVKMAFKPSSVIPE